VDNNCLGFLPQMWLPKFFPPPHTLPAEDIVAHFSKPFWIHSTKTEE